MKTASLKKCFYAMVVAFFVQQVSAAEPEFKITMQSADKPGVYVYEMDKEFAKWVEQMSNGRIKIEVLPYNTVVPYNKALDAVSEGKKLQGEFDGPSYFADKEVAFSFIGNTVGAWDSTQQAYKFFYYDKGLEIARKLYAKYNIYLVGLLFQGVESLPSSILIRGVEDLKGLKVRSPEGMVFDVFKAAGADPVILPSSEVYDALAMGEIDAADFYVFSVNQGQKIHEVARYPVYPGFHSMPIHTVAINMDVWNSIPRDLQLMMEIAAQKLASDVMFNYELLDSMAIREAQEQGVVIVDWPRKEKEKYRQIAMGEWDKMTSQSPIAKEFADALREFYRKYD